MRNGLLAFRRATNNDRNLNHYLALEESPCHHRMLIVLFAIVGGGCSGLLVAVHLFQKRLPGPRHGNRASQAVRRGPRLLHFIRPASAERSRFQDERDPRTARRFSGVAARPPLARRQARNLWPPGGCSASTCREVLDRTLGDSGGANFTHIRAEAIDARVEGSGAAVTLSDRKTVYAERVVLALGNPASCPTPGLLRTGNEDRWQLSPWLRDGLHVRFAGRANPASGNRPHGGGFRARAAQSGNGL